MIASVRGEVRWVGLDRIVVDVGGVGLLVHTTPGTAAATLVGQPTDLATSLVVREDSMTLYGFGHPDERALFETVQTVSGVGPRLALAMLAVHSPEQLRRAIADADVPALTRVPGIGRKGAERLVLELRDRITTAGGPVSSDRPTGGEPPWRGQVVEALVGLGWTQRHAEEALDEAAAQAESSADGTPDVSELLRSALRVLAR